MLRYREKKSEGGCPLFSRATRRRRPRTLTPRELARRCGDPPALIEFVGEYQEIRYGGRIPGADDISRLRELAEVIDGG
ncbi:MAG: DUF4129 domain-containing protein [Methanoculleaceae archaeon]